ncbi:hypothetical protein BDZ94DRAFT_1351950 [Collybia nuda]|uniref:Uncharacterized protein n=1 Tax=Collybia nuda TaxID=64659 RepID=A0A9P5XSM5_9AGAR|nr:hypothetical protein BDZ94DRAFT_1351950 [Collybia nuda]
MHLAALNIPDLLINLWRGILDCDKNNDRKTWQDHGKTKISRWEFILYLYCLGPGVFYNVLPEPYYKNFCKLVLAMRIFHQHKISKQELLDGHEAILSFCQEFEVLYYHQLIAQLHYIQPGVHSLTHLGTGVVKAGPGIISSQWTMECTIGNLVEEICQPSNPYMNLSRQGLLQAQLNALKSLIPDLEPPEQPIPQTGIDLGGGYALPCAREKTPQNLQPCEADAIHKFMQEQYGGGECEAVARWACLQLPTGQIARSAWKEKEKHFTKVQMSQNVKVQDQSSPHGFSLAEVEFYFLLSVSPDNQHALALFLEESFQTLISCTPGGEAGLCIIPVTSIMAVVGMVPHRPFGDNSEL